MTNKEKWLKATGVKRDTKVIVLDSETVNAWRKKGGYAFGVDWHIHTWRFTQDAEWPDIEGVDVCVIISGDNDTIRRYVPYWGLAVVE